MLQRKLNICPLVFYILLALAALYFLLFPSLFNPVLDDISIGILIFLCIAAMVYACMLARSTKDVALVLVGIVLLSFLARAIPHLRLAYPLLHDPYFYFISVINIHDYGTLQPVLSNWYPILGMHLDWPLMHLFTSMMGQITGIDTMWLFRFEAPLLGGIFSLVVFSLTRFVTKSAPVALLAALFASLSDVVIFYQSEYHPQGLALLLFVVLIYIWLKLIEKTNWAYWVLFATCATAFLFLHSFSSLYIGLVVLSFVAVNELLQLVLKRQARFSLIGQVMGELRRGYAFLICFGVAVLFYHLIIHPEASQQFLVIGTTPLPGVSLPGVSLPGVSLPGVSLPGVSLFGVPLLTFLLRLAKWGVLFLGAAAIIYALRKPTRHELSLILLLGLTMLCGVLGTAGMLGEWMAGIPIDRFIAFYAPLISVFAAITVYKLLTWAKFSIRRARVIKGVTILVAGVLLAAGFFNASPMPALYFKSSQVNTYYWYSNRLPSMDEYKAAGEWTARYIPNDSKIGTEFDTYVIPFFYGKRSYDNVVYLRYEHTETVTYIMSNPSIPYNYEGTIKPRYDMDMNLIYNNEEIRIYSIR